MQRANHPTNMTFTIERMLQKKLQLDIANARMVASEARDNLKVGHNILWSRILESECLKITELKGLTKDGIPVPPKRTEFILHSPVDNKQRPRAQSLMLSPSNEPIQKSSTVFKEKTRAKSLPSSRLQEPGTSDSGPYSPAYKPKRRASNAPRSSTKKDAKSIPQSPLPTVALSTIEEHHSSHQAAEMNRPKKPLGKPARMQEPEGAALQVFFANIFGGYKDCSLVQDNFKPLLFDYDLRTLASDGESVSSSNSGWTWGSSTKSSCTADMGVRQLAARFETGRVQQGRAPMKPKRQKSFDNDDDDDVSLGPPMKTVLLQNSKCKTNH